MDICEKLGVSADQLMGLSPAEAHQPVIGAIPGYDELLAVIHRFIPIMPRLSQTQHLALRRHVAEFQRFVLAMVDRKLESPVKQPRSRGGPHTPRRPTSL